MHSAPLCRALSVVHLSVCLSHINIHEVFGINIRCTCMTAKQKLAA